jgi:hypothetical protein
LGVAELTDTQLAYVEWRADPTREGSKIDWAAEHGTTAGNLRRWEKTPWYREALNARLAQLNIEPERLQQVLDALWREAKDGDVNAAKTYFAEIEKIRPTQRRVESADIADLSDEELQHAWDEGMASLARQRLLA